MSKRESKHRRIFLNGEIAVCEVCLNSDGYNIAFEQAHPIRNLLKEWG